MICLSQSETTLFSQKDEICFLYEKDPSVFFKQGLQGIGYKEWKDYFEKAATEEEVAEMIVTHSRQFARRQYTWLNHQLPVHWLDITDPAYPETAFEEIEK